MGRGLPIESNSVETPNRGYESELARGLVSGLPEAFDRFVGYFRAKIFHYTWLMCGQREDAEEVAQETLLRVFESMGELRDPNKVKSWVFRIARNECLMKRRKSLFAPSKELSLDEFRPAKTGDGEGIRIEIADWSALPEAQALKSQMVAMLEKAIRDLPETYRSVILLRDMEELSTEETARILDLGEDVVRTRLHRARLAVRRTLDEYLRGDSSGKEGNDGTAPAR
jgi:RNA polymerase sigma-70 factor (ECF subfamily)